MSNLFKFLIALFICAGGAGIIFAMVIGLLVIFADFTRPETPPASDESIAKTLLLSLQQASEMYVVQQGVKPHKFSDYVLYDTPLEDTGHTLTLISLKHKLIEPDSKEDLNTNTLEVKLSSGYKVVYKLTDKGVEAEFMP